MFFLFWVLGVLVMFVRYLKLDPVIGRLLELGITRCGLLLFADILFS